MANASKDENGVSTLIGASTADGTTPVRVYADPTSHRLLVQGAPVLSGAADPASAPTSLGQIYIQTTLPAVFISTGTAVVGDWKLVSIT